MHASPEIHIPPPPSQGPDGLSGAKALALLSQRWRLLATGTVAAGIIGLGVSFLIPPTYTARTMFLPPQQPQSAAMTSLASLGGSFAGLAGIGAVKSTADQYVSLLQSANVQDRLIDRFKLMDDYKSKYRFLARRELSQNVRIALGKKDGLITIDVDASSPQLAADLANEHVGELRRITGELALTEAQQRRKFFEGELKHTREQLAQAQQVLQQSGFNPGALKAEPKAAAESYARIKAEVTAAEVKLQTLRRALADASPEVQQQRTLLGALQGQLSKLENTESSGTNDIGYISKYREYKYQESLFEFFSRQFETARLDESREGNLIQVVDKATPPEYKSKPKRSLVGLGFAAAAFVLLTFSIVGRHAWQARRGA